MNTQYDESDDLEAVKKLHASFNVAIVGYGFNGKATERILSKAKNIKRIQIQDPKYKKKISPDEWDLIKYAFICVPTPLITNGNIMDHFYDGDWYDMSIIENAISKIPNHVRIVIRSTIGPDSIKKGWIHWPEFLREHHWEEDADDKSIPIIIGAHHDDSAWGDFAFMFPERKGVFVSAKVAATYKISRNAMLAAKIVQANYINRVCQEYDVEYNDVANLLKDYANLGDSHWDVPGPDGKFGFGGSCFPKDTIHFSSITSGHNIFDYVLRCNERDR